MSELKGLIHSLILGSVLLLYSGVEQTLHFMKMCNVTGTKWLWKYAALLFQALVPRPSAPAATPMPEMAERMCAVPTHSHVNSTFLITQQINLVWNKLVYFFFKWILLKKKQSFPVEILEFLTDSKWLCVSWEKCNGQMNSSQLLLWFISKITTNCQIFECHVGGNNPTAYHLIYPVVLHPCLCKAVVALLSCWSSWPCQS